MVPVTAEEETYSFIPLMKPILDLTKDWDIELIEYLEDYIHYVRLFDVRNMNFSEAAMLVQNSVRIYNKKVDSLANIFKEFLDILRSKPPEKKGKGAREGQEGQAEEGDENVNNHGDKRNKKHTFDYNGGLMILDDICAERIIDTKQKGDNKKNSNEFEKIILNTAIKVKPTKNYSIEIYVGSENETEKKEDFRLHWRISHCGTLNEEFSSEQSYMFEKQSCRDDTIVEEDSGGEPPPDESLPNGIHEASVFDEEHQPSELLQGIHREDQMNRPEENIVNVEEVEGILLQPKKEINEFVEKPITKKKNTKVPEEVLEARKENKRKWTEFTEILSNYEVTEFLIIDHSKQKKGLQFDKDMLLFEEKEDRLKKQLRMKRKKHFNELVLKEARQDLCGDFNGFHDMEPDGLDGFAGFDDENDGNQDNSANNSALDIPLPTDNEVFRENVEDPEHDSDSYENEVQKALQNHALMKKMDHDRDTEMKKRVEAWHKIIQPKLVAAEERAHFDIHEYGTKILDKFPDSNGKSTMPFADVVANQPPEEVARYFLSSLMLANTYNLEISLSDPSELAVDCMNLRLLSRARHYEAIDDNMRATSKEH